MNTPTSPIKTFTTRLEEVFNGKREALRGPLNEVEPGEVIVGTLQSPIAKAIFSLREDVGHTIEAITSSKPSGPKELETLLKKVNPLIEQGEILMGLFWQYVHEEFPDSRHPKVGVAIRRDWVVVIYKKPEPNPADFFRQLFG